MWVRFGLGKFFLLRVLGVLIGCLVRRRLLGGGVLRMRRLICRHSLVLGYFLKLILGCRLFFGFVGRVL